MKWIAPTEKDAATITLEKRLWDAADQFRANSGLKAQEYSGPILGLIFLRFAEVRFAAQRAKLEKASSSSRRGSRVDRARRRCQGPGRGGDGGGSGGEEQAQVDRRHRGQPHRRRGRE